jgi:hypothetical protein
MRFFIGDLHSLHPGRNREQKVRTLLFLAERRFAIGLRRTNNGGGKMVFDFANQAAILILRFVVPGSAGRHPENRLKPGLQAGPSTG